MGRPFVTDFGHDVHDHLGPVAVHVVAEDGAEQIGQVDLHEVAARGGRLHGDERGRAAPRPGQDARVNLDATYARPFSLLHLMCAMKSAMEDGLGKNSNPHM